MKEKLVFSVIFLFFFLFLARGGWLPTDTRVDTGDSAGASHSYFPQISCSGNNVYVVWQDYRNSLCDIYFNYSINGGDNWQFSDTRLDTGDLPGANTSIDPQISCSGNNVYVVWEDNRNGFYDIYFNYSTDGGANWQASDKRLDTGDTPGAKISRDPQISCSGSNVYVVWEDNRNGFYDIYFNYSTDGGVTWQSSDKRLDKGDSPGTSHSTDPQISCSGSNVYVVWEDNRNGSFSDIYLNYSTNSGASWQSSDKRLDTGDPPGTNDSSNPQISCSGGKVYVVWEDYRYSYYADIYFNYSINWGATWQSSDKRLDTGDLPATNSSSHPQISCNGSNVYVVWQDYRNNVTADIYFNYSTNSGATWRSSDIRLDTGDPAGTNHSTDPQISCSDSNVYVVWSDERNGEGDVYFNCSRDEGVTWMASDTRLDRGDPPGAHSSSWQQIACSDNNVYVVWQDNRNGGKDIYFNTASIPMPDIKANGSDGPITITYGDSLSINVELDAGYLVGNNADWWVLMRTPDPKPNNLYYFDLSTHLWILGRSPTHQGSLFDMGSKKVPRTSGLAPGTYIFYFGVDMVMNGTINLGNAYYDWVKVTINP